jgi:SAM-dependent methyltransferase
LVSRVGPAAVSAVDPSEPFVAAARTRNPGAEVLQASAEQLPFPDRTFDAALAQLVVHFMSDPVAGLAEMARVTRSDGVVAACVWDHAGGQGPLSALWEAARALDPTVRDESGLPGAREGHLGELLGSAGLRQVEETVISATLEHPTFDEWWEPYTRGVGPAGSYVTSLDAERQVELRETCRRLLPRAPFVITARAWAARGLV